MYGQMGSGLSGVIAATTNGILWAIRYPEGASGLLQIERLYSQWTTLTAFGTPVTAGRALRAAIYRQSDGHVLDPSGGLEIVMTHKLEGDDEQLARCFIANTAALTVPANFVAGNPRMRASLVQCGASGGTTDKVWRFDNVEARALYIRPGQMFAFATDSALDATGTGQLQVDVEARQVFL